jgi:hypothetical protein
MRAAGLPAALRAGGTLLLVAGVVAGLARFGGLAIGGNPDDTAVAAALDSPRDPEGVAGIRWQVQQMMDRGIIVAIRDGDPTIVVVTDRYLALVAGREADLPLYGGHFVGFAGDYAWLVNGTHHVRLLRDDGTEIGRRTGRMSDAQVQSVYRDNRRRRDAATAGLGPGRQN